MNITVVGMGYVGLSLAVLLSQKNDVTVVDIDEKKIEKLNNWQSVLKDDYIEKFLAEHEARGLSLRATADYKSAYEKADFVIVAVPTNYDPVKIFFVSKYVEHVIIVRWLSSNQRSLWDMCSHLLRRPDLSGSCFPRNFCVNPRHSMTICILPE